MARLDESVANSQRITDLLSDDEYGNLCRQAGLLETSESEGESDSELGTTSEDEDPTTTDEDAITESSGSEASSSEEEEEAQFTSESEDDEGVERCPKCDVVIVDDEKAYIPLWDLDVCYECEKATLNIQR